MCIKMLESLKKLFSVNIENKGNISNKVRNSSINIVNNNYNGENIIAPIKYVVAEIREIKANTKCLRLKNTGQKDALNVTINADALERFTSRIQYFDKYRLPIKVLAPDSYVDLKIITISTKSIEFDLQISWADVNGQQSYSNIIQI